MRILHIAPGPTWRGGERQVFFLARALTERGADSPVLVSPRSALGTRLTRAGIPVRELSIRGDLDLLAARKIIRELRDTRPDVLHLHTARAHAAGGIAARLAGFGPVIVTRRLELPSRGIFGRWKYRHLADHYVAISGAVQTALIEAGVSPDRIDIIPSGVKLPGDGTRGSKSNRPWTVGTLAAFTRQKDPDTWLETAERVCHEDPTVRFLWAGEGELVPRVKVAVEKRGLAERIRLLGFVEELEPFWKEVDVFFLPSAFEALGTVLLDALARGVPVVATRVGGIPEIVRDGREGCLAARGDAAGLSQAILRLRRDRELATTLGAAGRERAREFEIGRVVERTVELYERLVGKRVKGVDANP